jgi:hypothetical protein
VNPVLDAQLGLDILFESATGVAKVIFARLEALLASQREVSVLWGQPPKPFLRLCKIATKT